MGLCYALALLAFFSLSLRGVGEHYQIFAEHSRQLRLGINPYGVIFPCCTGPFLYSPFCSLFFFSLFSPLPLKWGEMLYTGLSVALFFPALHSFITQVKKFFPAFAGHPLRHLVWMMIASELLGSILATKLEIFLVAGALWGTSLLLQERDWMAACCLAMVATFKLQAVPTVILFAIILCKHRRGWRFSLAFLLWSLFFFFLPLAFLGPSASFWSLNQTWLSSISAHVSGDWLTPVYQHIFGFLVHGLGIPVSLPFAKGVMVVFGAMIGLFCLWYPVIRVQQPLSCREGILLSFGLGCLYVVTFAPLSQSNAYLWYVPSVFAVLYFLDKRQSPIRLQEIILGGAYFLISIAYSDLVPRFAHRYFYAIRIKAVGTLGLIFCLMGLAWIEGRKKSRTAAI